MRLWCDDELEGLPPGPDRARAWVELRILEFRSLVGRHVREWNGQRLALRDGPDGMPEFEDPAIPAIQLSELCVSVEDGEWLSICTQQDDDEFGLFASKNASAPVFEERGIFRQDSLGHLPRGEILRICIEKSEKGNIEEVVFGFARHEVILVAAEAWEGAQGELCFHRGDESVCLFTDRASLNAIKWYARKTQTPSIAGEN